MTLQEYDSLVWNNLDINQKKEYIDLYFKKYTVNGNIRLSKEQIRVTKLNSAKGMKSHNKIEYDNNKHIKCICPVCNTIFNLKHSQIVNLSNDTDKLLFCSKSCASKYSTTRWHNNKTIEEKQIITQKIKDTFNNRYPPKPNKIKRITNKEKYKDIIEAKCSYCGRIFTPSDYQKGAIYNNKKVYCSTSCATADRYNKKPLTQDTIDLIKKLYNDSNLNVGDIYKASGLTWSDFVNVRDLYNLKRDKNKINRDRINSMKKTCLEKYGVDSPMKVESIKNKVSDAIKSKSREEKQNIVIKRRKTKEERYQDPTYHNIEKAKETNLKKYGVDSPLASSEIRKKSIETNLKRYGTVNPMQST